MDTFKISFNYIIYNYKYNKKLNNFYFKYFLLFPTFFIIYNFKFIY